MLNFKQALLVGIVCSDPLPWEGAADLFFTLHIALPEGDDQASKELLYAGQARTRLARSSLGKVWRTTDAGIENVSDVAMPEVLEGDGAYSHWTLGLSSSGSGLIVMMGVVVPPRRIIAGVIPTFAPGKLFAEVINRG